VPAGAAQATLRGVRFSPSAARSKKIAALVLPGGTHEPMEGCMKRNTTLTIASAFLLAATLLAFRPDTSVTTSEPSHEAPAAHRPQRFSAVRPTVPREVGQRVALRAADVLPTDPAPAATVTDRGPEIALADAIATTGCWIQEQLGDLTGLPPLERLRRLAEIEAAAREFTLAALDLLDIDDETRVHATACALEPVWAEIQYANAAPDPASRLALLRLDRERMARFQKARALVDGNERAQAMAELDAWYQASLDSLFATDVTP
jgi:hypothetical protein